MMTDNDETAKINIKWIVRRIWPSIVEIVIFYCWNWFEAGHCACQFQTVKINIQFLWDIHLPKLNFHKNISNR
jgi:hypothetical protein